MIQPWEVNPFISHVNFVSLIICFSQMNTKHWNKLYLSRSCLFVWKTIQLLSFSNIMISIFNIFLLLPIYIDIDVALYLLFYFCHIAFKSEEERQQLVSRIRDSWKSDNYRKSNREKKLRSNLQKLRTEVKSVSFWYRKGGRERQLFWSNREKKNNNSVTKQ